MCEVFCSDVSKMCEVQRDKFSNIHGVQRDEVSKIREDRHDGFVQTSKRKTRTRPDHKHKMTTASRSNKFDRS